MNYSRKNFINKMNELAIYTFVNNDLKMDKGKIASQIIHATMAMHRELENQSNRTKTLFDSYNNDKNILRVCITYKATEEDIIEIMNTYPCAYTIDAGRTQVSPGSLTVVMLYPRPRTDKFKKFKLL